MKIISNIFNICIRRHHKMPLINLEQIEPNLNISEHSKLESNIESKGYEEAVRTLNTLQSNAVTLEKARLARGTKQLGIPETVELARRAGITLEKLDKLSVIHVSGTKGKGSTCAFIESILRAHGYTTGFFSSPHLVEVRERIRVNGMSVSRDKFNEHFWNSYNQFISTKKESDISMPTYFRFLTIMAFDVFIKEKVDVAIMEVGIGGTYDSTNIIRSPAVVAITSLDYDHTSLLGSSIEQIACHKAGIMKAGTPAFTVNQVPEAMQVIKDRALEVGCPVNLSPPLHSFPNNSAISRIGIDGEKQVMNLSLALQCCHAWLNPHLHGKSSNVNNNNMSSIKMAETFTIDNVTIRGIEQCRWPGRSQIVDLGTSRFYLDGAHTPLSLQSCVEWFIKTKQKDKRNNSTNILMFNCTGDRSFEMFLPFFEKCDIDMAIFCPNIVTSYSKTADQTNYTVALDKSMEICYNNEQMWSSFYSKESKVFSSISESIHYIENTYGFDNTPNLNILCTGSLHLIGGILNIFQNEYYIDDVV